MEILVIIIGAVTTIAGYFFGALKQKSSDRKEIEQGRTTYASTSLEHVMELNRRLEKRIDTQDTRINMLEKEIIILLKENADLKIALAARPEFCANCMGSG